MDVTVSELNDRNREWYVANRKRLTRGRWYVIDNETLAFGPFDSEHNMQRFFEEVGCPCSEGAYYVRAGNKNPESILETHARCSRMLTELFSTGQQHKLQYLEDQMRAMLDEMRDHSYHRGVQKDRGWDPLVEVKGDFPDHLFNECQQAVATLTTRLAQPIMIYEQLASSFRTIVTICNVALESPRSAHTAIVIALYKDAACAMQPQWPAKEERKWSLLD